MNKLFKSIIFFILFLYLFGVFSIFSTPDSFYSLGGTTVYAQEEQKEAEKGAEDNEKAEEKIDAVEKERQ